MPTITEIANHWGVSRPRASQLVKEGCPTNSLKAADKWRDARGMKRAATNGKAREEKTKGRPKAITASSNTGDGLLDALNDARTVQKDAFSSYQEAVSADRSTRASRLSEHNKALDQLFKAEKAYREEQERRGILATKAVVFDAARRAMNNMMAGLRKLPQEAGPQCNELEPLKSMKILQRAVDEILTKGANALRDLK